MPRAVEMVVKRTGEPPVTLRFLVAPGPREAPLDDQEASNAAA
jgi:general secretion pathway protein J